MSNERMIEEFVVDFKDLDLLSDLNLAEDERVEVENLGDVVQVKIFKKI